MRVAVMAQTRVALGLLAVACGLLQADAFAIGPARLSLGASPALARCPRARGAPAGGLGLKMGFLGWDIGKDLGGGKGIRDILGIIRCRRARPHAACCGGAPSYGGGGAPRGATF